MNKYRLVFEKKGVARYISHLDLMRTFQRAFLRAGVHVRHSEGFNPHAKISIALPLSVGAESVCELLDFETEAPLDEGFTGRLNGALPEGIGVLALRENTRKTGEIAWLRCELTLYYDNGLPEGAAEKLAVLFRSDSLIVRKRSKSGMTDFDIIPCIDAVSVTNADADKLVINAVVSAANPTLNPMLLIDAVAARLPELTPEYTTVRRLELLDSELRPFI